MNNDLKNLLGHQAKCPVVLRIVLKRDQHDETKG